MTREDRTTPRGAGSGHRQPSTVDTPTRKVLAALDDVWRTLDEIAGDTDLTRRGVVLALRSLKRRGLAAYRRPNGSAGVLRVGEWATTEAGDRAKGDTHE